MNTDLSKSLEQLENKKWQEPPYPSYLVTTIYSLRRKPLKDYTIEDLRISIGQNCSLEYLIPIALEKLKKNILAEGHFYEGDLLTNVLNSDENFWKVNYNHWAAVKKVFEANRTSLDEDEHKDILKDYKKFQEIHNERY